MGGGWVNLPYMPPRVGGRGVHPPVYASQGVFVGVPYHSVLPVCSAVCPVYPMCTVRVDGYALLSGSSTEVGRLLREVQKRVIPEVSRQLWVLPGAIP